MDASAPQHDMSLASDGTDGASPPHNVEAECAFLGALLYDNEVYHKVSDFLLPEHFYDPFHGRLYAKARELIGAGALADAVVLKNRLADDEGLAQLGGAIYLVDLMRDGADSVSAPEYARLVYELALRRELIAIGESIAAGARDASEQGGAERLIESAGEAIHALSQTGSRQGGYVQFRHAARNWIQAVGDAVKAGTGLAGLSTGIRSLDRKTGGLAKPDLIIIAGRPGMGKTALALNIAFALARAENPVMFNSLEMGDDQLAGRQLAMLSGISYHDQRTGNLDQRQMSQLIEAQHLLDDLPLYVDVTGGIDLARLRNRARRAQRQHGLSCLMVDYLQLMTGPARSDGSRVQEITAITMGLKALAKELNVPIIALSQLSRAVEQRSDKRPHLSDLRDSGSIEQDADMVLFCYREEYYVQQDEPQPGTPDHAVWQSKMDAVKGRAEIIIGKQRHGEQAIVRLAFDGARTRFYDMEERT